MSKNIDLAAEYLQRDLDKLTRWCAKWRIKLNPQKTKVIIFSKSRFAVRAEPVSSLYSDLLSYYPHIKFLGVTFDNRMTFTKHSEEISECCNNKFHCRATTSFYSAKLCNCGAASSNQIQLNQDSSLSFTKIIFSTRKLTEPPGTVTSLM